MVAKSINGQVLRWEQGEICFGEWMAKEAKLFSSDVKIADTHLVLLKVL